MSGEVVHIAQQTSDTTSSWFQTLGLLIGNA